MSKWFHFFFHVPDISLLFISLNLIFSALIVGFIRFFWHCDGFTIYHLRNFGPPNFSFWRFISEKFRFSEFLVVTDCIFGSCLYGQLGNADVFALIDGTPFSWAACCISFSKISVSFRFKRSWNFWIFRTCDIGHCLSQHSRFFTNAIGQSICLFFSCIGNVVIDRGWSFRQPKNSRRRVFGESNWNPRFFPRAIVTSLNFSGLNSHVWHRNAGYAIEYEVLVEFSFSPNFSWFSPQDSGRNFLWKKVNFQISFSFV